MEAVRKGDITSVQNIIKLGGKVHSPLSIEALPTTLPRWKALLHSSEWKFIIDCYQKQLLPLHVAVLHGRVDIVKYLLQHSEPPNISTQLGHLPIDFAASVGNKELVTISKLFIYMPSFLDVTYVYFTFWQASKSCTTDLNSILNVDLLLNLGSISCTLEGTLLHSVAHPLAASFQLPSALLAHTLLQLGERVDAKDKEGSTPLHYAVQNGRDGEELVDILVHNGAKMNQQNFLGFTPLHFAVIANASVNMVLKCAAWGADVNLCTPMNSNGKKSDPKGLSALHLAAARGNDELVAVLLKLGANKYTYNYLSYSPMDFAAMNGSVEVLDRLLQWGESCTDGGGTMMCLATQNGNINVVKYLIQRGVHAAVECMDSGPLYGLTPMHVAAKIGHLQIATVLLDNGGWVEVDQVKRRESPLDVAIVNNHLNIVELLVSKGAIILLWSVWKAVRLGYNEIAKYLMRSAAVENGMQELLITAAQFGNLDMVNWAKEQGANINEISRTVVHYLTNPASVLHVAAVNKQREVIELLLASGANIEIKDGSGKTAFHLAVMRNDLDTAELLYRWGANVNCQDNNHATPLHSATLPSQVVWLLDHGADKEAVCSTGTTPLSSIAPLHASECAVPLVERGANPDKLANFSVDGKTFLALMNSDITHLDPHAGTREYFWTIAGYKGDLNLALFMKAHSTTKPGDRAVSHALTFGYADVFAVFVMAGYVCKEELLCEAVEQQYTTKIMTVICASGVPVNTKTTSFSPLQLAAQHGLLVHADWLLRHGADADARCRQGLSAMDFALAAPDRYVRCLTLVNRSSLAPANAQ